MRRPSFDINLREVDLISDSVLAKKQSMLLTQKNVISVKLSKSLFQFTKLLASCPETPNCSIYSRNC